MKKFIGLIVLAIMFILPNNTKAAGGSFSLSCDHNADGSLKVNWTDESKLIGVVQCSINVKLDSGSTLGQTKVTFIPTDPKIVSLHSVQGSGNWNATFEKNADGTANIVLNPSTSVTGNGSTIELAKLTVDVTKANKNDNCNFAIEPCVGSDCFPKIEIEEKILVKS